MTFDDDLKPPSSDGDLKITVGASSGVYPTGQYLWCWLLLKMGPYRLKSSINFLLERVHPHSSLALEFGPHVTTTVWIRSKQGAKEKGGPFFILYKPGLAPIQV